MSLLRNSLVFLALVAQFGSTQVFAQDASLGPVPRTLPTFDPNGVDLSSGEISFSGLSASIGPSDGGLSWSSSFRSEDGRVPARETSNLTAYLQKTLRNPDLPENSLSQYDYAVVLGQSSSLFRGATGSIAGREGSRGKSLVAITGGFEFTDVDGTVVTFDSGKTAVEYGSGGLAKSIVRPNGERLDYSYTGSTGNYTVSHIVSNLGYMVKFSGSSPRVVELINLAEVYCDVTTAVCASSSVNWPAISSTSAGQTDLLWRQLAINSGVPGSRTPPGIAPITTAFCAPAQSGCPTSEVTRINSVSQGDRTWTYDFEEVREVASSNLLTLDVEVTNSEGGKSNAHTLGPVTRLAWHSDEKSRKTEFGIDSAGSLTSIKYPEGNLEGFEYATVGALKKASRTSKNGASTTEVTATYPSSCTGTGVNSKTCHKPVTTTDARTKTTDYEYDLNSGQVSKVTGPVGANGVRPQTRYTYSALNAKKMKSDLSGVEPIATAVYKLTQVSTCKTGTAPSCVGTAEETRTTYAYNSNNLWLTSQTVASGDGAISATTTYAYDNVGNLIEVDGPLAGSDDKTIYRYDLLRRKTGEVGPVFANDQGQWRYRATRTTYHTNGQVQLIERGVTTAQTVGALDGMTVLARVANEYDSFGRLTKTSQQDGSGVDLGVTQYAYDKLDRRICTTVRMSLASVPAGACDAGSGADGSDRITRTQYTAASEVETVTSGFGAATSDGGPRVEKAVTYTANGKEQTVADGKGNLTTYEYDGFDRLAKVRYPNASGGGSSTSDYEAYGYDENDNRTSWRRRSGETVTLNYDDQNLAQNGLRGEAYSYDNVGHRLWATYAGQTTGTSYDALGRATVEYFDGIWIARGYDAAGRNVWMQWPDSQYVIYQYDASGLLRYITEAPSSNLVEMRYDNLGRRTWMQQANGAVTTYAYDPASRLTSQGLDLSGTNKDQAWTFAYNPASQVKTRTASNGAYEWALPPTDKTYGVNGLNQMTSAAGATVSYDARGNLSNAGGQTYCYDLTNNLTGVWTGSVNCASPSGAAQAAMTYEPLGRLRSITSSAETVRFLYAGANLVAELNTSNQIIRRYVPGQSADMPLVWYEGSGLGDRRYLHADPQGSIVAISGNLSATNTYDEYGVPASTNQGRFQYTGQAWLNPAGVYHYKARAYSPTFGRFMQTDPTGYDDGINWYAYVGNDPLNKSDPSGLAGCGRSLDSGQCSEALKSQDAALTKVRSSRASLAQLRGEMRAMGQGKQTALSGGAAATQEKLQKVFGSSSAATIDGVDKVLSGTEKILSDDGSNYRFETAQSVGVNLLASEPAATYKGANHIALNQSFFGHPNAAGILIHEPPHILGANSGVFFGQEFYRGDALNLAMSGIFGRLYARQNADNYRIFVGP